MAKAILGLGIGIGAMIGGGLGGVATWQIQKRRPKSALPIPTSAKTLLTESPADVVKLDQSPSVPNCPTLKSKFEVFDTKTYYFNTTNEFYTILLGFEKFLQFEEEREGFRAVIGHIDNMLGMEILLGTRMPVGALAFPTMAQSARNAVVNIMRDIVTFSDEQRPSPTKKKDMTTIIKNVTKILDEIILNMHKKLAAKPLI